MKSCFVFFAVLFAFGQSSAWASPQWRVVNYVVDQDYYYSQDLQLACHAAEEAARTGLAKVETNLGLEAGTLGLNGGIVTVPITPGTPMPYPNPYPGDPSRWIYECVMQFRSKDDAVTLKVASTKRKTHLKKEEQATACKADFDEVAARAGTLFMEYNMGATLFQGRICDVSFVEATKK